MRLDNVLKTVLLCLVLVTALLLIGCSSVPSSDDAKGIIQERINKESEGRIKLVSFQKTNGQEAELFGVKVYQLNYQGEIEFLEDCKWEKGMAVNLGEVHYRTVKAKPGAKDFWQNWDDQMHGRQIMKKGHKEKISGYVVFEKTEKGWVPSRL